MSYLYKVFLLFNSIFSSDITKTNNNDLIIEILILSCLNHWVKEHIVGIFLYNFLKTSTFNFL